MIDFRGTGDLRPVRSPAMTPPSLAAVTDGLATTDGTISIWCGRPGAAPAYTRLEATPHYAASTMKVAVLAAMHRAAEAGRLDLDAPVPVTNAFTSAAPGAPAYGCDPDHDGDPQVWARLGGTAPPRWLAQRMIVRSSNLATNLLLERVGLAAVDEVWKRVGATASHVDRGIEDAAARAAGLTNEVTAHDLAALFAALVLPDGIASPAACRAMLATLVAQERREDLAAGLPAGAVVAHKNGWVHGVRHGAGIVFPPDAPPYVLAVCTTGIPAQPATGATGKAPRPDAVAGRAPGPDVLAGPAGGDRRDADTVARQVIAAVAAASYADRHLLGEPGTR